MKKHSQLLLVRYLSITLSLVLLEIVFGFLENYIGIHIAQPMNWSPKIVLSIFMAVNILFIPLCILLAENLALKLMKHKIV